MCGLLSLSIFLWQFVFPLSLGKLCFPWTLRSRSSGLQSAPSEMFDHSFLFLLPNFRCSQMLLNHLGADTQSFEVTVQLIAGCPNSDDSEDWAFLWVTAVLVELTSF